jgi:hypothetical protein
VDFILVSAVCQYRDTSGNWHDFERAPANDCSNCAAVSVSYQDNPCIGSDGGVNLPAGTWRIRGQADGYYINNGVRHDWGDGGALNTTSLPHSLLQLLSPRPSWLTAAPSPSSIGRSSTPGTGGASALPS